MNGNNDIYFMQQALALAERGRLTVSPNPMVGCVIVQKGEIVGEGYHQRCGEAHAEIHALQAAGDRAKGAQLYVTLEPCCHHGKTPPCSEALIKAGIQTVHVACLDPNPAVAGKGVKQLEAAGVRVTIGLCAEEAEKLNEIFFHYQQTERPFVIAKWAMSLDGKTTTNGQDRRISSSESEVQVHRTRSCVDAIIIGAQTARDDDPLLTTRLVAEDHKHPQRIVISRSGDLPTSLRLFDSSLPSKTLIATTKDSVKRHQHLLDEERNTEIMVIAEDANGQVDINHLLTVLGEKGITSVLVEGGMNVLEQFYQADCVNKTEVYIAPIIIGHSAQQKKLTITKTSVVGDDLCMSACQKNKE